MNLTHLDENQRPKMVDVSDKDQTTRVAVASGIIEMSRDAYDAMERAKKTVLFKAGFKENKELSKALTYITSRVHETKFPDLMNALSFERGKLKELFTKKDNPQIVFPFWKD